ncbi:MAG: hypothetical protein JSV04_10115 [Candidatus Heimdallarchaeota archaeon]|nr:MAG: hypothetical protein JSV04_10115 [Candidatus Heimdallarchaeota archaeon]
MNVHISSNNDSRDYITKIQDIIRQNALLVSVIAFLLIKVSIIFLLITLIDILDISIGPYNQALQTGDILVDILGTRWDSYYYLIIAKSGAYVDPFLPGDTRIWNFAPLYPLFIRFYMDFWKIFQIEIPVTTAGVIVANFFSLSSTIAFFHMSRLYLNEEKAIGATLLFSFFPTVFVFSTVAYAEPIFLTFAILSWFFFEKEKYALSGFTLALATLGRYPGAIIFFLYFLIYLGRKIRDEGINVVGCLLAIPLFPILVIINFMNYLICELNRYPALESKLEVFYHKLTLTQQKRTKIIEIIDFFDTGLSWVLVFGIIPLIWILFVNVVGPMPLHEIAYVHWRAQIVFPFAGFYYMLSVTGDVRWTLEKFAFAVFFIGIGLMASSKRPSFSLLIIAPVLFYTSYTGLHAFGLPRYVATIFLGPLVLAEELTSNKIVALLLSFFLIYGFKVLWEFCNWKIWLI